MYLRAPYHEPATAQFLTLDAAMSWPSTAGSPLVPAEHDHFFRPDLCQ